MCVCVYDRVLPAVSFMRLCSSIRLIHESVNMNAWLATMVGFGCHPCVFPALVCIDYQNILCPSSPLLFLLILILHSHHHLFSPHHITSHRYIRSLSEAMRPENFDLLSGEYHRDKRDKAKEKERLTGIAEGRPMDSDDNNRPMLVSEAVKKAPYAPTVEPAHISSASTSASATASHPTPPSPPTAAFTPTVPTPVQTTVPVSAPIVSPVPASIPAPHVPQIPPTSTALPASLPLPTPTSPSLSIPASVPVPVPAPMSSGRPPTVPPHHTPPLVPPVADLLSKGSITGLTGIAEVSNRAKVSHVPFDGTLPPLGAPDSDPSVAESEDELSPNEAPYRRKWGSKTDGGDTSDREGSEKEVAISMEGDATLREWMKTAQVL